MIDSNAKNQRATLSSSTEWLTHVKMGSWVYLNKQRNNHERY